MHIETTPTPQGETAQNPEKISLRLAATACVTEALAPRIHDVSTAKIVAQQLGLIASQAMHDIRLGERIDMPPIGPPSMGFSLEDCIAAVAANLRRHGLDAEAEALAADLNFITRQAGQRIIALAARGVLGNV